jgi:isopentenyl-diphosphate delta-isomerase type 1
VLGDEQPADAAPDPSPGDEEVALVHEEVADAAPEPSPREEEVVLVDEAGAAVGVARKSAVHHRHTPRHLAFSCYAFDEQARLLVTTRALTKASFPGLTTNTVCGHPMPGERLDDAVRRRAYAELGLVVEHPTLVLPDFSYDATMGDVREHEACPVLLGRVPADARLDPDPAEVHEAHWEQWADFRNGVLAGDRDVSPWCALQVALLDALGPDPLAWPAGDPARLPPAAQPGCVGRAQR